MTNLADELSIDRDNFKYSKLFSLTNQEWRVLIMLADDKRNMEIAGSLFLATKSVENYISRIGTKLDLKGKDCLANSARRNRNDLNRVYQVYVCV